MLLTHDREMYVDRQCKGLQFFISYQFWCIWEKYVQLVEFRTLFSLELFLNVISFFFLG